MTIMTKLYYSILKNALFLAAVLHFGDQIVASVAPSVEPTIR